ncbi:MAG: hypothetical protein ABW133_15850 [Polyangiaceae bacterium]
MRPRALCISWIALCSLSCDSNGGPGPGGSGDGARYIEDFAALVCNLTSQCCAPQGFSAPTECVAKTKVQLQQQLDANIDGGMRFDSVAGDKCMAAYRGLAPACPNTFDFDICHDVFTGGPAVDAGCMGGCAKSDAGKVNCISFSSTAGDGAVTKGDMSQLEVMEGPGQPCDSSGRMPVERHSDRTKNSNCIQGICSTPKPLGAACTDNTNECIPEAICKGSVCVARVPVGSACTTAECVPGANCDMGKCVAFTKWKKWCAGNFD